MKPPRSTLAIFRAQRTGFGGLLSPPGSLSSREPPPGEACPQGRGGGEQLELAGLDSDDRTVLALACDPSLRIVGSFRNGVLEHVEAKP